MAVPRSLFVFAEERGPQGLADPPPAGSAGRSGKGQLRAPSAAARNTGTAAFGASATADAARAKAYRNMTQIMSHASFHVERFFAAARPHNRRHPYGDHMSVSVTVTGCSMPPPALGAPPRPLPRPS